MSNNQKKPLNPAPTRSKENESFSSLTGSLNGSKPKRNCKKVTSLNRVRSIIAAAGAEGVTADQIEILLSMRAGAVSGRVNELLKSGYAIDSGFRRKARSGRLVRVVVATSNYGGQQ